jgi:hypothetical protein
MKEPKVKVIVDTDDLTATQRTVIRCAGNILSGDSAAWLDKGERRKDVITQAVATAWDVVAEVKATTPNEEPDGRGSRGAVPADAGSTEDTRQE